MSVRIESSYGQLQVNAETEFSGNYVNGIQDELAQVVGQVARAHRANIKVVTEFYPDVSEVLRNLANGTGEAKGRNLRAAADLLEPPQ